MRQAQVIIVYHIYWRLTFCFQNQIWHMLGIFLRYNYLQQRSGYIGCELLSDISFSPINTTVMVQNLKAFHLPMKAAVFHRQTKPHWFFQSKNETQSLDMTEGRGHTNTLFQFHSFYIIRNPHTEHLEVLIEFQMQKRKLGSKWLSCPKSHT